jgi:hypothetical protein
MGIPHKIPSLGGLGESVGRNVGGNVGGPGLGGTVGGKGVGAGGVVGLEGGRVGGDGKLPLSLRSLSHKMLFSLSELVA